MYCGKKTKKEETLQNKDEKQQRDGDGGSEINKQTRRDAFRINCCETMLYSCVPNGFYFALRSMSTGRSAQTYEQCSNLSIFSP